jgi:hypothetical protein
MSNIDKDFLEIKISVPYYTDILGKEVSDVIVSEYDHIMREAKKMVVPEEESESYFILVRQLKEMNDRNYPPAKRYMEINLKKFAKKAGLSYDLMPYFIIAIFGKQPLEGKMFLDTVFHTAIEFVALMKIAKKKQGNNSSSL